MKAIIGGIFMAIFIILLVIVIVYVIIASIRIWQDGKEIKAMQKERDRIDTEYNEHDDKVYADVIEKLYEDRKKKEEDK